MKGLNYIVKKQNVKVDEKERERANGAQFTYRDQHCGGELMQYMR